MEEAANNSTNQSSLSEIKNNSTFQLMESMNCVKLMELIDIITVIYNGNGTMFNNWIFLWVDEKINEINWTLWNERYKPAINIRQLKINEAKKTNQLFGLVEWAELKGVGGSSRSL